jgi:predicted Zn-dependent protease
LCGRGATFAAGALATWLLAGSGVAAVVLLSLDEEIALGRKAQTAMLGRTPRVSDRAVRACVAEIGRRLVAVAGGPSYPYSFNVADYTETDALALPGGPVWIYRGALASSATEAQLAGVLAHEVAHLSLGHPARQLSSAMLANTGLGLLGALLGNTGGAATSGAAATAMTGALFLGYSREDERAADREGTRILARAGWDPRGLLEFLAAARRQAARRPSSVEVFLSTHPATDERIARLREETAGMRKGRRSSARFADIRRRLGRLPPARHAPRP